MTDQPVYTSAVLEHVPDDRPLVLLMRHAARPPLVDGETGVELSITPEGDAAATALGRGLRGSIRSVRTSPVRRCWQTALSIVVAAGFGGAVLRDRRLGDPGAFVVEPKIAWESWQLRGHDGMLEHFAAGAAALPGFAEPVAAALSLVEHLLRARRDPGVHLAITHDAIMLSLLAAALRRPLARSEWPEFLETVAIWEEHAQWWLRYRGEAHEVRRSSSPARI